MTITEILNLYWRNAKGTFVKPYRHATKAIDSGTEAGRDEWGVVVTGQTFFLPLTMPIVPLVKTIVDVATRSKIPQKKLTELEEKIKNLEDFQLDWLVGVISCYGKGSNGMGKAQSDSSKKLCELLPSIASQKCQKAFVAIENELNLFELQLNKEKREEKGLSETMKAELGNSDGVLLLNLNENDCKEIEDQVKNKRKELQESPTMHTALKEMRTEQRKAILDYIKAPHNNGKRLLDIINRASALESFEVIVEKEIARLRKNAQFGIGNLKKAAAIQSALDSFKKNSNPNANAKNDVMKALAQKRFGLFGGKAKAFKNVSEIIPSEPTNDIPSKPK